LRFVWNFFFWIRLFVARNIDGGGKQEIGSLCPPLASHCQLLSALYNLGLTIYSNRIIDKPPVKLAAKCQLNEQNERQHVQLRRRGNDFLRKPQGSIRPRNVSAPTSCPLLLSLCKVSVAFLENYFCFSVGKLLTLHLGWPRSYLLLLLQSEQNPLCPISVLCAYT
jgi:hypothetical protein